MAENAARMRGKWCWGAAVTAPSVATLNLSKRERDMKQGTEAPAACGGTSSW